MFSLYLHDLCRMTEPTSPCMHTCDCLYTPFGFILRISPSYFLTTLNLHVQILERETKWTRRLETWLSSRSSQSSNRSSSSLSPLVPLARPLFCQLVSISCKSYFCIFGLSPPWCNIYVNIKSHFLINLYSCILFVGMYNTTVLLYSDPCFVLMLSVHTWGYFCPAYVRRSDIPVSSERRHYTNIMVDIMIVLHRDIMIMVNILTVIILALVNILLAALNVEVLGIIIMKVILQPPPPYYSDVESSSQSSQPTGSHQQIYYYPYGNYISSFYIYGKDDDNGDFVSHPNSMWKWLH